MNKELFERLLYEEESTMLDFKKEQYRFTKATKDEKSELLKDILGFANAWRRLEAYILIGVEDVRGERGNVCGIPPTDHLDDHSLQQFVNNLTNQPVRFHYKAFGFEGKQVGIISIDEQTRPFYLKQDYGKLAKNEVYVRRGSSTDPTKPASPEEIAQMRVGSGQPAAELLVEFAHVERDDVLGTNISWETEFCKIPAMETIPDLSSPQQPNLLGIDFSVLRVDPRYPLTNRDFFRELAQFEFKRRLFQPVRLVVRNIGKVAANNVRAELTVPRNIDATVLYASKLPNPPKRHFNYVNTMNKVMEDMRLDFRHIIGEVVINKNAEQFRIEVDWGDLQPGRGIWSDVFYIAKRTSGDLALSGLVFADNLPQPNDFTLTASINVTETTMTVDELCSLPDQKIQNT